ncbi:hypothetical protein [Planobispora longispora]|uniref:Uncharacterized protein n=1 Tax=Planobispora longispora TaxID=28887 RepID=A0A8J3RSR2_9ACTN|nr:hypothetical protein [Planobispora longispora]GIH80035.1 hypothetical protein Plo01_64640 [Planobispora longispora]
MDPHPHGNPLTHLCERAGIPQLPYALEGLTAGVALVGEGGVRVRSSLQSSLIRSAAGVEDAAAKFTARTPPSGAPAASAGAAGSGREETLGSLIDAYCATETDAGRREWMRFILHTVVETELAAPAGGLSTAVLEVPEPYGGGDDVPGGGCRRLITALTPDAPIRTGATSRSRRAAYRPRCGKGSPACSRWPKPMVTAGWCSVREGAGCSATIPAWPPAGVHRPAAAPSGRAWWAG